MIGVLTSGDNIAKLKPLGDRVLIKVRPGGVAAARRRGGARWEQHLALIEL